MRDRSASTLPAGSTSARCPVIPTLSTNGNRRGRLLGASPFAGSTIPGAGAFTRGAYRSSASLANSGATGSVLIIADRVVRERLSLIHVRKSQRKAEILLSAIGVPERQSPLVRGQ